MTEFSSNGAAAQLISSKARSGLGKALLYSSSAILLTGSGLMQYAMANDAEGASVVALEEVIVTARARPEQAQNVPDAITIFSAETIEQAGIETIDDFFRMTPSLSLVDASQSPGIALINIRGIGQQLNSEPPVAVVVDGVQIASPAAINQTLLDLERIEVLKGPQGALYGRNAAGGAIVLTTRQPGNELEGMIRAGYANGSEEKIQGVVSGPVIEDRLFFKVAGYYSDFDGTYRNVTTGETTNPLKDRSGRFQILATPDENITIDMRASFSKTNNAGYQAVALPVDTTNAAVRLTPEFFDLRPASGTVGFGERTIDEYSVKISYETEVGTFSSTTAYVDSRDASGYDLDQQPINLVELQLQSTVTRAWSEEIRLTSDNDQRLRYTGGFYYLHTKQERETVVALYPALLGLSPPLPNDEPAVISPTDVRNKSKAWAGFLQLNYDVTNALELTAALRYDKDSRRQTNLLDPGDVPPPTSFDAWQPKASLRYILNDDVTAYATFGKGFRSGRYNTPSPTFPRVVPSEKATNYEVGLKTMLFDRRVSANFAAFVIDINDLQVTLVDVLNSGAQGTDSIPKARVKGFEFEMQARPLRQLTLAAGLGYLDTSIREFPRQPQFLGNKTPYTPELTYNLSVQWTEQIDNNWEVIARADHNGQSGLYYEYFNNVKQKAFGLTNFRLSVQNESFSLTGYVENAFGTNYYSDIASGIITSGLGTFGIKGLDRRYGVEASYRF